ncbi:translocation/assembly module TamB domain-containing protein [Silvibacterium sp.]|uniref:translocation/assembly module TamB domain-containing protein n=1 Tax=Silvibacterium sp. TaxID=1964179 RepID=UPI0039E31F88
MSAEKAAENPNGRPEQPSPPRRSPLRHVWRVALIACVLLLLLVGIAAWYASTPAFSNRVRQELISVLEKSTGGRVDLGAFHWNLWKLQFEADNLTIHGLEGPGETPYAHADRIWVDVQILSFLRPAISLDALTVTHPVVHIIVYADGTTNQPHPKVATKSNKPVMDTIFDLAVKRAEVNDGLLLLDEQAVEQRALPFDLSANRVRVLLQFVPAPLGAKDAAAEERYDGDIQAEDLTAVRGKAAPIHAKLDVHASLKRNSAAITSLKLETGKSVLTGSASLDNFANPQWKGQVKGAVDIRQVNAIADIPGLDQGQATLDVSGQGDRSSFAVSGHAGIKDGGYHVATILLTNVNAETQVHLDNEAIDLTNVHARLAAGGLIDAEMHIHNWLNAAPSNQVPNLPPATTRALRKAEKMNADRTKQQATIRAKIRGLSLRAVMGMVAPRHFEDLGFDTVVNGDAGVDWTGSPMAFTGNAKVSFAPSAKVPANEVPLTGNLDAGYSNVTGMVSIRELDGHTPASQFTVNGNLGVYPITRASALNVQLTTQNLGEFNQTMTVLGVAARGEKGVKALPVALQGQASFQGTISQGILDPKVDGQLQATNFDLLLPAAATPPASGAEAQPNTAGQSIHVDAAAAHATYSSDLIALQNGTVQQGKTTIHLSGALHAHELSRGRHAFDDDATLKADVGMQNASIPEILKIAGQDLPVTGTLNLQANVGGTLGNLNGGGHLAIAGGSVYGESYRTLNADLGFSGQEIDANHLVFQLDGGQLTGNGGYNYRAKNFHVQAQGTGFDLAHIERLQNAKYPISGLVDFQVQGNGTIEHPNLQAALHLTKLNFAQATTGYLDLNAHTQGQLLLLNANAHLNQATLQANGQVQLSGDYQSKAQLNLTGLDVDPILESLSVRGVEVHSTIAGALSVSGPLKQPKQLSGDARFSQFQVSLGGIPLKSDGDLHATLSAGVLHLDPLHITGEDTNTRASGEVGIFDKDRELDLHADGSVNMKLAQVLDKDITSSGHVDFNMDAGGTMSRPGLTGQVKFTNVAVALEDFPNGLSQMNGTLAFDQDRLDVKNLTAVSGGGKITLGGFLTYQQGLYADLNATAKDVRVRYPQGVSSMADAKMRLQGTQASLLLSGTVTITRFVIGPDLDLASLSSSAGSVSLPPDPNSPSNKLRLDVHVVSAPELDFQNSYAKLAGDVDLRLRGTLAQPSVLGHITVTDGSATFAGVQYELQHGDIYFNNPLRIEPTIDLSATARVEDYDITVGLTGTSSKLTPAFRSEPPLSEQDIFSLLALGRTQEEQQIYSNEQSQAGVNSTADTLLGGALNATVSSRIQKLFGGGSVKIDPTFVSGTGDSTARITVQQQVSKNATLTYATNVNSTEEQLIQAQWNLTETFSVLAVRDEQGVFSLLFKIRRRYR